MTDERGVSDTLSFVLVFALVISGVGLVTVFGMSSLVDAKDGVNAQTAERGFVVLAEDIDELERSQSPVRTSDIALTDATLAVTTGPSIEVSVGDTPFSETFDLDTLAYRTEETEVSYAGGGVFRTQEGGTAVVSPPTLRCTSAAATVSLVRLTAEGSESVAGGTARVAVTHSETRLAFPETRAPQSVTNVSVTTTDERWQRALAARPGWTATGPDTHTCSTERVFVRVTTVSVDLE